MAKTVATMKTNIGNNVQDTSPALASKILVWLNDAYQDACARYNWADLINEDYTFESVVGTNEYSLPADFGEEIALLNIATGLTLKRYAIGEWHRERGYAYDNDTIDNGTSTRYVLLPEDTYLGQIKLDPPPDTAETYKMPYKKKVDDLIDVSGTCTTNTVNTIIDSTATFLTNNVKSGMKVKNTTDNTYGLVVSVDSETQLTIGHDLCPDGNESYSIGVSLIRDIDRYIEYFVTGTALAYKRKTADADWWLNRAEFELQKRIDQERSRANQNYQWVPSHSRTSRISRLTGDRSYDSI